MFIMIIGGGICGLGTGLLLARDGHDVTVLEHDAAPVPASLHDAWECWERKGVTQFRQPHNFMPGLRLLLEAELPDVQAALGRAGAYRFDLVNPLPPVFADRAPRPVDEKLWTFTARRPVGEWVFADAAQRAPRLTIRRGVTVAGLLTGPPTSDSIPHVVGVRASDGEAFHADLVIDATGRQSRSPQWLAGHAAGEPEPHPLFEVVPGEAYFGHLASQAKAVRYLSLITRGIHWGNYTIHVQVNYDIEQCQFPVDLGVTVRPD